MSLFDTFATNAKAEAEGRWFNFPANTDKTVPGFLLARMSRTNPKYQAAVERVGRTFKTEMKLDILSEPMAFEPMLEVFCDTVLLGWRNVQQKDGTVIDYTRENAIRLMTTLPALYDVLREHANSLSAYRDEQIEANRPN